MGEHEPINWSPKSTGFSPEAWDVLLDIARRVKSLPPPDNGGKEEGDGMSGDREPKNPLPRTPLSGAFCIEIIDKK